MDDRFLGFVLGVRTTEVAATLRRHGVVARVRKFSPPASLAFGLSRKRLLEKKSLPIPPIRRSVLVLMGLWAAFAASVFFTVAAFFLARSTMVPWIGVEISIATGILAVVATAIAVNQLAKEGPGATLLDPDRFPWGILLFALTGTELDFFLIGFLLMLILVLFVLYVAWLPLLLLFVSLLTLGQLWAKFRGTLVIADAPRTRELGAVAEDLLQRGTVLSKSWDSCLEASAAQRAARLRATHYLLYQLFVAAGLSSLAGAGLALLSREVPSELWTYPIAAAIAAAISALVVLTFIGHQRRVASAATHSYD